MIRINKDIVDVPNILLTNGITKAKYHIDEYELKPNEYQLNSRSRIKFDFDDSIYTDGTVKSELKKLQGHKCCFCESKVDHISHGHIEHFRPKAAYKQDKSSTIVYPGYYWLAYEWSNLFYCCEICNGRGQKDNYFPLVDNSKRSEPNFRDISLEDPFFIIPSGKDELDPEKHIYFINEIPTHFSDKGMKTIEYLKLDRVELNLIRESGLKRMQTLENILLLTKDSINANKAREMFLQELKNAVQTDSQYSSMYKNNFSQYLTEL